MDTNTIHFEEITKDNFKEIMNLHVSPEQTKFVAHNSESMVEAH